jgi:hypothetical protein
MISIIVPSVLCMVLTRFFMHTAVSRSIILQESGSHFDPVIVPAFEACAEDFQQVRKAYADDAARGAALAACP